MTQSNLNFSDLETRDDLNESAVPDKREKFPCTACAGSGTWVGGYVHRVEGKCHACNGRGFFYTSPEQRAQAKLKRFEKKQAAKAERQQRIEAAAAIYRSEHGDLIEYLEEVQSWNGFAQSMLSAISQWGQLTEGQERAAYNGMAKHIDRKEEQTKMDANRPVLDLTRINKMFDDAINNGLKRPKLRVNHLEIYPAPMTGKNAGFLYVKTGGEYGGKISSEGKLFAVRSAPAKMERELIGIAADPMGKLTEHGRITGECGCCGRELTNKESIERGIGPICAERYGLL